MRSHWEKSDIKPGRYVISKAPGSNDTLSYKSTVTYKICWLTEKEKGSVWCFVSVTDGMIIKVGTKQDLADKFNSSKNGFEPIPHKELMEIFDFLERQNTGQD
jgi:hypothetical protein